MASNDEKEKVKNFAIAHPGKTYSFYDGSKSLPTMQGRVVGFYYAMALIVMESLEQPLNPIDPIKSYLSDNGALLVKGSYYCFVSLCDIVTGTEDTGKVRTKNNDSCPKCGKPAFILFNMAECGTSSCGNFKK
jgi:hypothetical protein